MPGRCGLTAHNVEMIMTFTRPDGAQCSFLQLITHIEIMLVSYINNLTLLAFPLNKCPFRPKS